MKRLILVITLTIIATTANAGWCNGVGAWKQCFSDNGDQTIIQNQGGSNYEVFQTDRNGRSSQENYNDYSTGNNGDDR